MKWPSLLSLVLAALALSACDSGGSGAIQLELVPTGGVALAGPAKVAVTVYGLDIGAADAPADVVYVQLTDIDRLPATVALTLPPHLAARIDQGFGPTVPEERARFFIFVTVDQDGDGLICPGDFRSVEDGSGNKSFGADLGDPADHIDIPLGRVDSRRACQLVLPE